MRKSAHLIVRSSRLRVGEISIHLVGLQSQDVVGRAVVAEQTLAAARITPGLDARGPRARGDGDVFIQSARQEIGIAIVVPPFVRHSVDGPVRVSDQQPRLQTFSRAPVISFTVNSKCLTKTVPFGKAILRRGRS